MSVIKPPQPLRIKPVCLSKSCLLIIMPIDHKAYELSDLLSRLLSLSACLNYRNVTHYFGNLNDQHNCVVKMMSILI